MDKYHNSETVKIITFPCQGLKKKKRQMEEPAESVIIRAQQNFDADGELNPEKKLNLKTIGS